MLGSAWFVQTHHTVMPSRVLCALDDLLDNSTKGYSISSRGKTKEIFLVRCGDNVYGYVNSCPHTGSPLDWVPDQFLSEDKAYIQCATHFALFRIEDGLCISGPCANKSLKSVPIKLENNAIVFLEG